MFSKLKYWWNWNRPIITTNSEQAKKYRNLYAEIYKFDMKSNWSAINPVIHSLKELRNNTWDKERVDTAIKWLEDNFRIK